MASAVANENQHFFRIEMEHCSNYSDYENIIHVIVEQM